MVRVEPILLMMEFILLLLLSTTKLQRIVKGTTLETSSQWFFRQWPNIGKRHLSLDYTGPLTLDPMQTGPIRTSLLQARWGRDVTCGWR